MFLLLLKQSFGYAIRESIETGLISCFEAFISLDVCEGVDLVVLLAQAFAEQVLLPHERSGLRDLSEILHREQSY